MCPLKLVHRMFCSIIYLGQFYGSSVDTRIDVDNCIGITPEGIFHLSVTKDTYHRLGIEGKLSSFAKKHRNRYCKYYTKLNSI